MAVIVHDSDSDEPEIDGLEDDAKDDGKQVEPAQDEKTQSTGSTGPIDIMNFASLLATWS